MISLLSNSNKVFKDFFRRNGPRNWMEYLLFIKHFENRGWDVALYDNNNSEEEWKAIEDDPNSISIPMFSSYDKIIKGCAIYFTPPEEIEELADTLPGGFRVDIDDSEFDEYNSLDEDLYGDYDVCDMASPYMRFSHRLPSELLQDLKNKDLEPREVNKFYFTHPEGYDALIKCGRDEFKNKAGRSLEISLSKEDIKTAARMENGNTFDINSSQNWETEKEARKSLANKLYPNGLVQLASGSSTKYTLNTAAVTGEYVALVRIKLVD